MSKKKNKEEDEEIVRYSLRWPISVRDKIRVIAKKEHRSVNEQIVYECDKRKVK